MSMNPGDLVMINRFGEPMLGVYIGPASFNTRSKWRFLIKGDIVDLDLENKLVYSHKVINEAG